MHNLNINLFNGSYDGPVVMTSSQSKVTLIRAAKQNISEVNSILEGPGVYFLLVGTDDIYVGQSSHDSVGKRIMNTHSGTIDSSWHTVIGFVFSSGGVSSDELLYMENAMCEYVYKRFNKCLTVNPARNKCTDNYRNHHYGLTIWLKNACKQYLTDMEFYLSMLPELFPHASSVPSEISGTKLFCKNQDGADATAILKDDGKLIVLKDSMISIHTTPSFQSHLQQKRANLESTGIIVNRKFQSNWEASSVSTAAGVVMGRSANGRIEWKTADGVKVGDLMNNH